MSISHTLSCDVSESCPVSALPVLETEAETGAGVAVSNYLDPPLEVTLIVDHFFDTSWKLISQVKSHAMSTLASKMDPKIDPKQLMAETWKQRSRQDGSTDFKLPTTQKEGRRKSLPKHYTKNTHVVFLGTKINENSQNRVPKWNHLWGETAP